MAWIDQHCHIDPGPDGVAQVAEAHGGSRTAKQARERWLHVVDPSRKQGEWTEEETALVIRLQKELGNR